MNRRAFLSALTATASGLLVPEQVRAYSFVGGWREHVFYDFVIEGVGLSRIALLDVMEHMRRTGRAGVLTRADGIRMERLTNGVEWITRARVPGLRHPEAMP